jgi:hypothetical protein
MTNAASVPFAKVPGGNHGASAEEKSALQPQPD